jgi:hypothetical protein
VTETEREHLRAAIKRVIVSGERPEPLLEPMLLGLASLRRALVGVSAEAADVDSLQADLHVDELTKVRVSMGADDMAGDLLGSLQALSEALRDPRRQRPVVWTEGERDRLMFLVGAVYGFLGRQEVWEATRRHSRPGRPVSF